MIYVLHIDITQIHNQHHVFSSAKIQSWKPCCQDVPQIARYCIHFYSFLHISHSFWKHRSFIMLFVICLLTFMWASLFVFTFSCWIVQANVFVQYIAAAFGSVCGLKWDRKCRDLFYPQTHCPWDELAEVKAGAVRFNFVCPYGASSQPVEQEQLWRSLHERPRFP